MLRDFFTHGHGVGFASLPVLADMHISVLTSIVDKKESTGHVSHALHSPEISNEFAALFHEQVETTTATASSADAMHVHGHDTSLLKGSGIMFTFRSMDAVKTLGHHGSAIAP